MNETTIGLVRQLREAIKRSSEGYPLQITFEPFQLAQLGEILDHAEQRHEESEMWRRVEALAKRVLMESPEGATLAWMFLGNADLTETMIVSPRARFLHPVDTDGLNWAHEVTFMAPDFEAARSVVNLLRFGRPSASQPSKGS